MPLIRRQPFIKSKPPTDLKPQDEVFYCKLTNEIFKDYEAFFERIILCNSLVWSCAITGRTGLTYQEALECEAKARKSLGAFPVPLRRPTLCLAALTRRTRLNDMNEDVYSFMKDRYFVGEHVDVIHRNQRRGARVCKVIVAEGQQDSDDDEDCVIVDKPSPDVVDLTLSDSSEASGSKKVSAASSATSVQTGRLPPADGYHYMVQFTDRKETVTVRADQCLRKKGTCTREKSKLFLKQHCEPGDGIWRVQNRYIVKFKIGVKAFEEVFSGPRPSFQVAVVKKRPHGAAVKKSSPLANGSPKEGKKKGKFCKDSDSARKAIRQLEELEEEELKRRVQKKALTPQEKARLLEQLRLDKQRQREVERTEKIKAAEQMKAERKNFRDAERMRRLEEQRVRSEYLREWSKPRDDLSCDDLKPLPEPVPVSTSIPEEAFGDALMLVEFFRTFDNIVNVSDVFTEGVSLEVLERVLKEKDLDGPLFDLVKVLLTTIFELQEEENIEEEEMVRELKNMAEEDENPSDASSDTLIRMATRAAQVPMDCHNTALSRLSLDPYTVTEILRLHLLSSGARASVMNAAFRYQERGGFTSLDDAGFDLTKKEPDLLNQLALWNIFDLDSAAKMKLLVTLTDQIMSYAAARDVVEDYADQLRMARADLRQLQLREMRYDKEDQQVRWKRRCEEKAQALAQAQKPAAAAAGPVPAQTDQAAAGDDSRTSSRIKAQTQNKEEEDLQKRLDKLSKKPESILTFSEEGLTPLQVRYLDDKKMEYRAMKREEGREEQRELQAAIINLQHSVGNCPLGRDRMFRRYWVFAGTEGVFVEDDEENVPEDCRKPVRQNLTKNPHHADVAGHEVNNLLRVNQVMLSPTRGKPAFPQTTLVHVPSPSVLQQGPRPTLSTQQHTPIKIVQVTQSAVKADSTPTTPPSQVTQGAQSPVKVIQSSPIRIIGPSSTIKVTSPGCGSPVKQAPAVSTGVQLGSTVRLVPTVGGVAVGPAITGTITSTSASLLKTSPTNDKENVNTPNIQRSPTKLIINGGSYAAQQSGVSNSVTVVNGSPSTGSSSPVKIITLSPSKIHSTPPQLLSPTSGQSLLNKPLPSPAVDQILNPSRVRWAYIDSPDAIDQLIGALNARGHREKQLKAVLLEKRDELRKRIQDCNKAFFCSGSENDDERTQKARMVSLPQNYRKQKSQGIVKDDSAQEQFELTLRELLLDMEERIFFGSLGSVKVSDRPFWRESIEQGSYSAQIEPVWAGMGKAARAERMETDADEAGHAVQDLSKALLQVEQGVDKRYLNAPLGDADKTKKAKQKAKVKEEEAEEEDRKPETSTLDRWESSLMASTSLCQVFLHMTTLESSIAWSKSALHARCRICRRKGDAEQMLLCDMCDRGHHMYCLKPKVTKVPQGDWFCPECRPKDVQRTPRKRARRREEEEEEKEDSLEESSQEEEEEEEDGESSQEEEDGEESDDETEETEDSEGESDEETEVVSEEEEEENPEPPKIKLASKSKAGKKSPPAPKKASRNSTGSRKSTPTSSTSKRTSKGNNESFDLGKKRKAETPPVSRSTKRRSVGVNGAVEATAQRSPALASSSRGKEAWSKLRQGEELVRDMVRMDDSWPFLKPVTRKEAPDYHTIIKTPIDLSKIRMKMNNHEYADAGQLVADVRLMLANCERYNVPSSEPAKAGVRLAKLFEKKVKEQNLLDGDKAGAGERRSRRN